MSSATPKETALSVFCASLGIACKGDNVDIDGKKRKKYIKIGEFCAKKLLQFGYNWHIIQYKLLACVVISFSELHSR